MVVGGVGSVRRGVRDEGLVHSRGWRTREQGRGRGELGGGG